MMNIEDATADVAAYITMVFRPPSSVYPPAPLSAYPPQSAGSDSLMRNDST